MTKTGPRRAKILRRELCGSFDLHCGALHLVFGHTHSDLGDARNRAHPTDIFPNIKIPVVSIIWNFNGLVPEEMSDRIAALRNELFHNRDNIEHIESSRCTESLLSGGPAADCKHSTRYRTDYARFLRPAQAVACRIDSGPYSSL